MSGDKQEKEMEIENGQKGEGAGKQSENNGGSGTVAGMPGNQKKDGKKRWQIIAAGCLAGGLAIGFAIGAFFGYGLNRTRTKLAKEKQVEKEKSGKYYKVAKEVSLGKYRGLKISLVPTEEDLQNEIDSVIQEYTNYEQKKGTARDGDMVYGEFEGRIGGVKMEELCGSDYIDIGGREWLEDFENAFIGMKTGKTKKVSVKVPEGAYGNDRIDGKTVKFKLKLKYICGDAIEPDYNNEFIQSISDYQTVEEYNAHLKEELEKSAEEEKAEYAWSEVMEKSDIKNYPEDMVAAAKEEVLQGYYDMADVQGCTHDEIFQSFGFADEPDFVENQLEELALDTVKEIMVAQAVANKEGISYTKKEYASLLEEEYEDNKSSYDSEEDYEKSNKNYLEHTALIEKVKSWIDKETTYERDEKK